MTEIRRILVVVDPTEETHPGVERASWLAKQIDADVELFACDYDQHLAGERFFDSEALALARAKLLARHRSTLNRIAEELRHLKGTVSVDARWDHPFGDSIVRKAVESQSDLVIKETDYHPFLKRSIFSNTDWSLIRACPAPLLLVKPRAFGSPPTFIAAVDPLHEHDKPASLDKSILSLTKYIADATHGRLEVFHAYDPSPIFAVAADSIAFPIAMPVSELIETLKTEHRAALDELLDTSFGADRPNAHLLQGRIESTLVDLAEEVSADCVAIGAVSRSVIGRLAIGSTAERVLDHVPCDLLVVKPPGIEIPPH